MAGAERGGAETAFVDMCAALKGAGQDIAVVTRANDLRVSQLTALGLQVYTLPFGGAFDFKTRRDLRRIIARERPHIVQTWMARACHHTPRWTESMHNPRYHVVARLGGYYKLKYFRAADYFTTITPMIRDYLIKAGIAPERVRHINNFAETETAPRPVRRADFETPDDAVLLLALGRLHESKAYDVLLDAMSQTPDHIHLWIAGEGPERKNLESRIGRLGLQDRVRLLGWRTDRAALLAACDICVFPSRYEPFGTVFVQAWAARRPVVVSDADGPRQFVRDGVDGLMVEAGDAFALAQAIASLAADPALRARLVAQGYIRYETEFTKDRCVQAYLDFYAAL